MIGAELLQQLLRRAHPRAGDHDIEEFTLQRGDELGKRGDENRGILNENGKQPRTNILGLEPILKDFSGRVGLLGDGLGGDFIPRGQGKPRLFAVNLVVLGDVNEDLQCLAPGEDTPGCLWPVSPW